MSFDHLGLAEPILRAVREQGYTAPTPIQLAAIPAVLAGGDLLAGAQTGTGKTAGFVLPMLQRLAALPVAKDARGRHAIRALILTPTRELAAQVEQSVRDYGRHLHLRSLAMFGGVGMQPQIDALKRGIDILVATPGRLLDHHGQGTLDLSRVQILVLDEADRMLDMGFIHDIRKVLALVPPQRQSLLFSATFSDEIKALAERLLNRPQVIEVARRNATVESTEQTVIPVDRDRKKELLAHLIQSRNWFQVLVFTRMKHGANRLTEFLNKEGISALAIHGNKSQGARTKALADFKSGELQVLVATDIAARGIDIDQLPHVVNFELPNVPEDYVHRIGRTGRAGASGEAISLVCIDEEGFLDDIQKLIRMRIARVAEPGFEPDPRAVPQPIQIGRQTLNGASRRGDGAAHHRGAGSGAPGYHRGGGSGGASHHRGAGSGAPAHHRGTGSGAPAQQPRGAGAGAGFGHRGASSGSGSAGSGAQRGAGPGVGAGQPHRNPASGGGTGHGGGGAPRTGGLPRPGAPQRGPQSGARDARQPDAGWKRSGRGR